MYNKESQYIDRIGIQGDAMTISVCQDNSMIDGDIALFNQSLSEDGELIGERLKILSNILKKMGY